MENLPRFTHDDVPLIQLVNQFIINAIDQQASDMHIEPYLNNYRVRYRRDGVLITVATLLLEWGVRSVARLKVMAQLDVAERRIPQDGRFTFEYLIPLDCRVSTCSTMRGEKVVVRFFKQAARTLTLDELHFHSNQHKQILQALHQPQGMIVVTGPTGSGKTQTLYTLLSYLNEERRNIVTLEDPVEMTLEGLNQVQVNSKTGLTFSIALRSFLRQDPDVIMIGEIRDSETAAIAIRAAQTGHLDLSTLHTSDTAQAITRLLNLGVERADLASTLRVIVAQRLIQCLCTLCGGIYCTECHQGYSGRRSIFEVMPISNTIRQGILSKQTDFELMKNAQLEGMLTLYQSGMVWVERGVTDRKSLLSKVSHETL